MSLAKDKVIDLIIRDLKKEVIKDNHCISYYKCVFHYPIDNTLGINKSTGKNSS